MNPELANDPIQKQTHTRTKLFAIIITLPLLILWVFVILFGLFLLDFYIKPALQKSNKIEKITESRPEELFALDDPSAFYFIERKGDEDSKMPGLYLNSYKMRDKDLYDFNTVRILNPDYVTERDLENTFVRAQGVSSVENNETVLTITNLRKADLSWQQKVKSPLTNIKGIYKLGVFKTGSRNLVQRRLLAGSYTFTQKSTMMEADDNKYRGCPSDPKVLTGVSDLLGFVNDNFFAIKMDGDPLLTLHGPIHIIELENGKTIPIYKADFGNYYATVGPGSRDYDKYNVITDQSTTGDDFIYENANNVIFISNYGFIAKYIDELMLEIEDKQCVSLNTQWGARPDCFSDPGAQNVTSSNYCTLTRVLTLYQENDAVRSENILRLVKNTNAYLPNKFNTDYKFSFSYPQNWETEKTVSDVSVGKENVRVYNKDNPNEFVELGDGLVFSTSGAICGNGNCMYGGEIVTPKTEIVLRKLYQPNNYPQLPTLAEYRFSTGLKQVVETDENVIITGSFQSEASGQIITDILNSYE